MSAPEWTPVAKSVRVGDLQADLHDDGTVTLKHHARLLGDALIRLPRSEIEDLLVALDGVQGGTRESEPKTWAEQIPREAMTLARNVYAWTASKATVEVTVSPDVWCSIASEHSPFVGDARWEVENGLIRFYDGSVLIRRTYPNPSPRPPPPAR